jgi:hypothetical protein
VFLTPPLEASPDPLRESLFNLSLGNRYIDCVWTPFIPNPCGALGSRDAHSGRPGGPPGPLGHAIA